MPMNICFCCFLISPSSSQDMMIPSQAILCYLYHRIIGNLFSYTIAFGFIYPKNYVVMH
uniref:Uncharacterized protein n=1 Tax=Arundo donax TaxID=35708 RepID=A0A0A9A355_ARUDO